MNTERVAEAWIEMWSAEESIRNSDKFDWVTDIEYEWTHESPEQGFQLVKAILEKRPSTNIIEVLAAGPLEDILACHGEELIEVIELEARRNPEFAWLLGGVWKNSMSDKVWERVQKVWNRKGWDGNA